jgi:biotin-dependent carboxylase-like uncharacterized protein
MIAIGAVAGLVTVQDGGRPGFMHQGVPPGGAMVPAWLARANLASGNEALAAGLEIVGKLTIHARNDLVVSSDDGTAHALASGQTFTVACERARVRYLAIRGGIDVPAVLGSRSTLLGAGLGGYMGRALRKGDVLPVGRAAEMPERETGREGGEEDRGQPDLEAVVRVVPGPDLHRFAPGALDALLRTEYSVSPRSDRVGVRLVAASSNAGAGSGLARSPAVDTGVSAPMVLGAIQVPAAGEPIVLGPDHPTTGGYPVVATVVLAHVGGVMGRPVGSPIRFVRAGQGK